MIFFGKNILGFPNIGTRISGFFKEELILGSFLARLLPILFAFMALVYGKSKIMMAFSMLILVTSDNFLQLFFGWEGVGLCSYFLIGFWFKKNSANAAAMKAFVVNRVGDFGFAIGIFLIFYYYGTVSYNEVFQLTPQIIQKQIIFLGIELNLITLICLLLFVGAMG